MTSSYLTQPRRSEAEAVLDKCEAIRAAVENFKANISQRIKEVGGEPEWIVNALSDGLTDAIYEVEQGAKDAIYEAECRDEAEHERIEGGLCMVRSGVQFGRVA